MKKMKKMKIKIVSMVLALSSLSSFSSPSSLSALEMSELRSLPVQAGGRVKPLDTYARESVRWVTGKTYFLGRDPLDVLCSWMAEPDLWKEIACIEVRHLGMKDRLKLAKDRRWFTPKELTPVLSENPWVQEVLEQQRQDKKLSAEEQEAASAVQKLMYMAQLVGGEAVAIVPHPSGGEESWRSVHGASEFSSLPSGGLTPESLKKVEESWRILLQAYRDGRSPEWSQSIAALSGSLRGLPVKAGAYPSSKEMGTEVDYNLLHPFRRAWVSYGTALLILWLSLRWFTSAFRSVGFGFFMLGIGWHGYGIFLRCMIAGRPPVTNMYESVVWVTFGAAVFGLIFELINRRTFYFIYGSLVAGIVGLILADNLPNVLNPNLDPLVPVLRDNFWLTVHVLSITLSYAAFTLAMAIGHVNGWMAAFATAPREKIVQRTDFLYRVLQVGVLFLAAGTILGGVWADQSWGRFWGWDPKETWALIALLGYLVVLHGRRAGWLGAFGLAVSSIVAYQCVLMAWYGVNFVLGQGLHSYGFGTGGVSYVMMYVGLELAYIVFLAWKYKNEELRMKN